MSKLTEIGSASKLAQVGLENLQKKVLDAQKQREIAVQNYRTRPQDRGGFLGGVGYLGEKVGAGFMAGVEGFWDFAAGGIADAYSSISGDQNAHKWAEEQIATKWFDDWYSTAGEWYNPSEGWQNAGNVAQSIGSSLPALIPTTAVAIGAAAATVFSGGTAAPVAVPAAVTTISTIAGGVIAIGSAGGQAVSEAYDKTGKLGGNEWGYGALVGVTEGGIEAASLAVGLGAGKIAKALTGTARASASAAARTGARSVVSGVLRTAGSVSGDFASEAVEEGLAEIMSPYYARATYDPNAKNATAEEVAYAAIVGGVAGVILGGVGKAAEGGAKIVTAAADGKAAFKSGTAKVVLDTAKLVTEAEENNPSGYKVFQQIAKDYRSLEGVDEEKYTNKHYRKLAELQELTAVTRLLPAIEESAVDILMRPQEAADRFAAIGVTNITAEGLTAGLVGVNPNSAEGMLRIRQALSNNPALTAIAVADAAGKMMLQSSESAGVAARGISEEQYNLLQSSQNAGAIAQKLGLGESLDGVDYATFAKAREGYAQTEGGKKYISATQRAIETANGLKENTDALPEKVGDTARYGRYAIIKDGDRYRIYDYNTGNLSFSLSENQANEFIRRVTGKTEAKTEEKPKTEDTKDEKAEEKPKAEKKPEETPEEKVKRVAKKPAKETPTEVKTEEEKTTKVAEEKTEKNGVTYEGFTFNEKNATDAQRATVAAAELLYKLAPGVKVHVYETVMDGGRHVVKVNGKAVTELAGVNVTTAPNGFFAQGNHIYIDINATRGGKQVALYTLSHEVTHYLYANAKKSFFKIANFLTKKYRKTQTSFEALQAEKKEALKKQYNARGEKVPPPLELSMLATEEVVCDSMSRMLADTSFYEVLAEMKGTDTAAHKSFLQALKATLGRLKELLKGYSYAPSGEAGDTVAAFPRKAYRKLQKLYAEALMDAETHAKSKTDAKFSYGDDIDSDGLSQYNEIVLTGEERHALHSKMLTNHANKKGVKVTVRDAGYSYVCMLDEDSDIHCYGKSASENIHDVRRRYNDKGRRRLDRLVEGVRGRYGNDSGHTILGEHAGEQAGIGEVNNRVLRQRAQRDINGRDSFSSSLNHRRQEEVIRNAEYDAEYISAVERGDMEKAQEIIIKVAEDAGYIISAYHGTRSSAFTEFKRAFWGIFLASNRSVAERYAGKGSGHVFDLVAKLNRPYVIKADINLQPTYADSIPVPDEMAEDGYSGNVSVEDIASFAKAKGYDGVIIKGVLEDGGIYTSDIVVFNPRQVKSTETITYDDKGEIIPPSERFNDHDPDIRYSDRDSDYLSAVERGDTETEQRIVDEAAEEAMTNSVVRDENGKLLRVYHGSGSKFTVFDPRKMNAHGNAHGRGFYFTEDKAFAEGYAKEGGQLLSGYLNIEKPFSEERVTISKRDLEKLIKAIAEDEADTMVAEGGYGTRQDALRDTWVSAYVDTYGKAMPLAYREVAEIIYTANENDVEIIAEITNAAGGAEAPLRLARDILGYDGVVYENGMGTHEFVASTSEQFKSADPVTYDDNGNIILPSERFNTKKSDIRYSERDDTPKITIGMSDAERTEILRQKKITPVTVATEEIVDIDWKALENERRGAITKALLKKLQSMGAIKTYSTDAVDVQFDFTGGGFRKSLNSQIVDYGGSVADFAKVVLNMQPLLDSAVLLEIHADKAKGTPRENPRLRQTYVLLSAFSEEGHVSPVQFEIKRYIDEQNRLYLAVALTKMEADVFEDTALHSEERTLLLPASTYSIPQFVEKINPRDENFFKYIPDELLGAEQKAAKERALRREAEKYRRDPRFSERDDSEFADQLEWVGRDKREYTPSFGERVRDIADRTYAELFDAQIGIERGLVDNGMSKQEANALVQRVRSSGSAAQSMLGQDQYNHFGGKHERVGEGLTEILKPTRNWSQTMKDEFDFYLLNWLNVDAMTLEARSLAALQTDIAQAQVLSEEIAAMEDGKEKKAKQKELGELDKKIKAMTRDNRPIFKANEELGRDHDITAEESEAIVKKLEEKHPAFKDVAAKIYGYLQNSMQKRVDAGLVTQEAAERMAFLYPHYLPVQYDSENGYGFAPIRGAHAMAVSQTIRRAIGGKSAILKVADAIAQQTIELERAGNINILLNSLYPEIDEADTTQDADDVNEDEVSASETAVLKPTAGQITFFKNGERVTVKIPDGVEIGINDLRTPSVDTKSPIERGLAWVMKLFREWVTTYSPVFTPRNAVRDIQDAGLNSKHARLFAKHLRTAPMEILKNSENWRLYRSIGAFSSSVFQDTLGAGEGYAGFESIALMFKDGDVTPSKLKKAFNLLGKSGKAYFKAVENVNNFVEQIPRFAEFCASLEAGDSVDVALYNSAEVTTNFGRHGKLSKKLNAVLIPFLNANLQGFDKMLRNVGDAVTAPQAVRATAKLLTKAVLVGMTPMLVNMLMYGDDDEYEALRDTDKENYFLIKISEDSFIKIPRGRVASAIGGILYRGSKIAKGEDPDLKGYAENVWTNLSPVDSMSRDIFSPLRDVASNTTWYGSKIEGQEFDDTRPSERYDESTSSIAIALGKVFNQSPKKIHYLLDQYTGVVGDLILPATSQKENRGLFSGNLTIDSVLSNKWSTKFYELYDETNYKKTEGDESATYEIKYLNRVKKAIKTVNDEIDAIRTGEGTNGEKLQKVRVLRALVNEQYKSALDSIEAVREAIENTKGIEDETLRDAEITRIVFGAETAIKQYDKKVYEKYSALADAGVSYDDIYDFYFSSYGIESDTDKYGNVIDGSKRKKVFDLINAMDIPVEQKVLLADAKGYTVKDGDIKGVSASAARKILGK